MIPDFTAREFFDQWTICLFVSRRVWKQILALHTSLNRHPHPSIMLRHRDEHVMIVPDVLFRRAMQSHVR